MRPFFNRQVKNLSANVAAISYRVTNAQEEPAASAKRFDKGNRMSEKEPTQKTAESAEKQTKWVIQWYITIP
ncbi:MAG: hypothetical protein DHS20C20_31280 [Ardenticatenaceae bacterium]|nr:MAG: hypothetical protein DHS20C20_31280 [Ardenticatenaceae bacterium]